MSGLPAFFESTSDGPYDRHHYKFVCSDGSSLVLDNYEDVRVRWHQLPPEFKSHIEVLDAPTKGKGF